MDFYKAYSKRRSTHDFTDESIPESVLKRIIEAGYTAPANDHFRDGYFIQMHK